MSCTTLNPQVSQQLFDDLGRPSLSSVPEAPEGFDAKFSRLLAVRSDYDSLAPDAPIRQRVEVRDRLDEARRALGRP